MELDVGARGVHVIELWSILGVDAGHEESHSEWPREGARLVAAVRVAELDGQVGDGLDGGLHPDVGVVAEPVVLGLDAGLLNQDLGI